MKKLQELLNRREAIRKEMRSLVDKAADEKRELSEDENTRFEALKAEREQVSRAIEREELLIEAEREDREARSIAPADAPERPEPSSEERSGVEVGEDRARAQDWRSGGEFLRAVIRAERPGGGIDARLREVRAATGMGESVGADGGFLVPTQFSGEIVRRMYETGQVLSRCRRIPVTQGNRLVLNGIDETSRATGSRFGGVQAYWVDEGTAATASAPKFRKIDLKVNRLAALVYATDELLEDTTALEAVINEAVPAELTFATEDAIINGTGAGQPVGLLNSAALVSVAKESGQAASTVVKENIFKMWARAWARSRQNAVWLINQDIEPQLFGLTLGDQGVYFPAGTFANSGPFGTLFGRPVIPVEYCATLGTKGDILLVDLSQYVLIDKGAPQSASSMHVRFINHEMAFRFTYRVDGQSIWHSALTPFKGSNTQSPFISVDTRA